MKTVTDGTAGTKGAPLLFPPNSEKTTGHSPNHLLAQFFMCPSSEIEKVASSVIEVFLSMSQSGRPSDTLSISQYWTILNRFALECPLQKIREQFKKVVEILSKKHSLPILAQRVPSRYLGGVPRLDDENPDLLWEIFIATGRTGHLDRVLSWHPSYLKCLCRTTNHLMRSAGPLPLSWRNYIAILASSRHRCTYIMRLQAERFLAHGGDKEWLKGIEFAPRKIQIFLPFAAILAHQPWRLTPSFVKGLVQAGSDSWTIAELVYAILVFSTWVVLSSTVLGCGIVPEDDFDIDSLIDGRNSLDSEELLDGAESAGQTVVSENERGAIEKQMLEKLKSGKMEWDSDVNQDFAWTSAADVQEKEGPLGQEEFQDEEDDDQDQTEEEPQLKEESEVGKVPGESERQRAFEIASEEDPKVKANPLTKEVARFVGECTMPHKDFDLRSKEYHVFHAAEYSWQEHCYVWINQSCGEIAQLLDTQLETIQSLTYRTFSGSKDVNTDPFRLAVWHYVQRIQGIFHDDYDYREVNVFLGIPLKGFIKDVTCLPEMINRSSFEKSWSSSGLGLKAPEKCHVSLLAAESRKLAILMFGMRAVMNYQTRS